MTAGKIIVFFLQKTINIAPERSVVILYYYSTRARGVDRPTLRDPELL